MYLEALTVRGKGMSCVEIKYGTDSARIDNCNFVLLGLGQERGKGFNDINRMRRSNNVLLLEVMMADNQLLNDNDGVGGADDIFVYTGGEQQVPLGVKRVRIAENVDTILERAFRSREQLIEVEGHRKIKKIEARAFRYCRRLRGVTKMTGVIKIEEWAFYNLHALIELEFDKLEIIGTSAFRYCRSLRSIKMPSIRRVGTDAFVRCHALMDAVFGEKLERIEGGAFHYCTSLRRITIPLKDDLIIDNFAFSHCENLSKVDTLAGEIHTTISSLHLETWRNEMEEEIDSINQTLPNIRANEKAEAIQQWITRVLQRIENYEGEHQTLLKEAMTLLELALWKTKLLKEADDKRCNADFEATKARIDVEASRKEHRVTCGASIVIKNVLPFLALK